MELPTPVAGVCTTFLAAVPDGLVTGLCLRGDDVTLSGVKIGTVTAVDLDRKTYQAVVHMAVASRRGTKIPLP